MINHDHTSESWRLPGGQAIYRGGQIISNTGWALRNNSAPPPAIGVGHDRASGKIDSGNLYSPLVKVFLFQ